MASYAEIAAEIALLDEAELADFFGQMQALEAFAQACQAAAANRIHELGSHHRDGARTLTDWLQSTGRHHRNHAHRIAETARALQHLPHVWERFADGELSLDQTAEVARFATAETDEHWAAEAPKTSAHQLARCARQHRKQQRETTAGSDGQEEDDAGGGLVEPQPECALWVRHRLDGTGGTLTADFDVTSLGMIEAALMRQGDTYPRDEHGARSPRDERMAQALFDLVTTAKRSCWTDRITMTVHTDLATLARLDDDPMVMDMPYAAVVAAEEGRRLAETAHLEVSLDDEHGRPTASATPRGTGPRTSTAASTTATAAPADGTAATTPIGGFRGV